MAHPVYKVGGKRVPSVTTVLGRFKDSGGLIRWAHQRGLDGMDDLYERDAAAYSGTMAHNMIEAHLLNEPYVMPDNATPFLMSQAEKGFDSFLQWEKQNSLEILVTECSMTSVLGFGGTPDAIGYLNGKLTLLDWKTSKAVYADYVVQCCAYVMLWDEVNADSLIDGGVQICRFSKDHADFETRSFGEPLDEFKKFFLLLLEAYQLDKRLRKRVR